MNTSHFPSLDLCKRLTEAGFPQTEYWFVNFTIDSWYPYWRDDNEEDFYLKKDFHISSIKYQKDRKDDLWIAESTKKKDEIKLEDSVRYSCPSIAELLDELPNSRNRTVAVEIYTKETWNPVIVYNIGNEIMKTFWWEDDARSIPNALAECWLWLKENDLLPK